MTPSLLPHLVQKDLAILAKPMLSWWLGGLGAVAGTLVGGGEFFLLGMILFVTCLAGAGFHAVMQTVVEERKDQSLLFIMSLPISVREYTAAKLLVNFGSFFLFWLTLSAASLMIFLGEGGMQNGALPFVTIVLIGILLAYTTVLATGLLAQSMGISIASIVVANVATQLFLWWVVELKGIASTIQGDTAIWSGTASTVIGCQLALIVALVVATHWIQARRTDFP